MLDQQAEGRTERFGLRLHADVACFDSFSLSRRSVKSRENQLLFAERPQICALEGVDTHSIHAH